MARRYSGDLTVYVTLPASGAGTLPHSEQERYQYIVCKDGVRLGETFVGRAASERRADDNPSVIDETARSALTFLYDDDVDVSDADCDDAGFTVRRRA